MESLCQPRLGRNHRNDQDAGSAMKSNLLGIINHLIDFVDELGEGFSGDGKRLRELRERLTAERFHLAVLGQFKRGKSTLINALIGESLLPTSVLPLTSIPTFLSAGPKRVIRVFFLDRKSEGFNDISSNEAAEILANYVTEERNPLNKLAVSRVEVEHPAPLLHQGVVVIDTPGIGSTFRHNTDATLNFLPQCDAALFVVSADPPITEVEREFLRAVRDKVAKVCFVMNKIDYLTEREREAAVGFFEKSLKEMGLQHNGPIFSVSARQGIDARVREEPPVWRKSGLEDLQGYLLDFFSREKSRTLQLALARKALAVVADVSMNINLRRRALQLSQQELEKRVEIFERKIKELEQEKVKMRDLLAGDRKRTAQLLEDLAETLRRDARRYLNRITSGAIENKKNPVDREEQAQAQLAEAIPVFFQARLVSFSNEIERTLQEVLLPYEEGLDTLIGTLRSAAAELFDIPYRASASDGRMEKLHKPYWVTQKWSTAISPVPEGFLDRFLPPDLRKRRLQKRLSEEVEMLVTRNVENVRWATLRNLDDAFRRFSSNLEEQLRETAEAIRDATRATRVQRKENKDAVQPELKRLEQKAAELTNLENSFTQFADSL